MPEMSSFTSATTRWRQPSLFNLLAIALLLALAGLGAAYLLVAAAKTAQISKPSSWSEPLIRLNLAGAELTIPRSWMRTSSGENGQDNVQADLQVDLELNLQFAPGAKPYPVRLRLIAAAKVQPSSYLLDTVYMRQFSSRQKNTIAGLVGKPLKPREGFQGETVWYDPLSPNPFVAKCLDESLNSTEAGCLRTVQMTRRLAVIYRFDADLLAHWKNFDATMQPILAQIGVFTTP